MRPRSISAGPLAALFVAAFLSMPSHAAGDAQRGARVFRSCAACHSVTAGEHQTGPALAGIVGRKAASAEGFERYSEPLKRSGIVWSESRLDKWLANPSAIVPGTSMTFEGLRNAGDRDDVIAYLGSVPHASSPAAASGNMMMSSGKADLRNAPPQGQVVSITHCGETYTVETADGKVEKVWEFNLRFKTDSSSRGPPPGKPAIVGAGMRGDRASVVFASPNEISSFIKKACP